MSFRSRFPFLVLPLVLSLRAPALLGAAAAPAVGPFFEPDFPVFGSQVQVVPAARGEAGPNFVVRGLLLPLPSGHCVLFDQELMRVAAIWKIPAGQPPVTLLTMAQISYASPKRKAAIEHPAPTGPVLWSTRLHPGVAPSRGALFDDPRPPKNPGDEGRGALPADFARFTGIDFGGATAVLHYASGGTEIREWHEARVGAAENDAIVLRHFEIAPHAAALHLALGSGTNARPAANSAALALREENGEWLAVIAPAAQTQRVSVGFVFGRAENAAPPALGATPPAPQKLGRRRWDGAATAPAQLDAVQQNGLVLDRIATPDENPWQRRVRAADLAFLSDNRAAVLTYDGDVWLVDGFADPRLASLTWRRFASGLHEPLALAAPQGVIQVATKNGVVRLHDRDGNGEADWLENFNDQLIQSQTTRSFPLDMGIGPDGVTYISQGGIVTQSGLPSGGSGTAHTGGILKISPDGRRSELVAARAREPFVAVHPKTGVVTATDQQGHFIPSSVSYLVRPGDNFGFLQEKPEKLAPPLAWIPHDQDTSSSSEAWMLGAGLGPYDGKLVHLSFGTGRMFLIAPDLEAPVPQGAVIPLDLRTDLPLLHARMHPRGDALFLAGFQIWGTRATTMWSLGRLRRGDAPIVTAIDARSVGDGVVLAFAAPLDPASLAPERVAVRAWNYKRSSAYGSGRYALDGAAGSTPWGVAQTVLAKDGKSVFVHLPKLPPVMQLEVRHDFKLAGGAPARGVVYFTIHQPQQFAAVAAAFPPIDLARTATVIAREKEEPPSREIGRKVAETIGCAACHSADGTTEGKVGPTWLRLFGAKRTFVDGTTEIADEIYLREKILDPQQRKLKPGQIEMPSYRGVLSEQQIESLVLYIKSLGGRPPPRDDG